MTALELINKLNTEVQAETTAPYTTPRQALNALAKAELVLRAYALLEEEDTLVVFSERIGDVFDIKEAR